MPTICKQSPEREAKFRSLWWKFHPAIHSNDWITMWHTESVGSPKVVATPNKWLSTLAHRRGSWAEHFLYDIYMTHMNNLGLDEFCVVCYQNILQHVVRVKHKRVKSEKMILSWNDKWWFISPGCLIHHIDTLSNENAWLRRLLYMSNFYKLFPLFGKKVIDFGQT